MYNGKSKEQLTKKSFISIKKASKCYEIPLPVLRVKTKSKLTGHFFSSAVSCRKWPLVAIFRY